MIKVLVVDDSALMRKLISDMLESVPDIEVAGTAGNGLEALEKVKVYKPDVITLDIEMPVMDGISCLKEILKITDAPVIMLSAHTKSGEKATIQALDAGAVDFVTKPEGISAVLSEEKKKEIIEKITIAGNISRRYRFFRQKGLAEPVSPIEYKGAGNHELKTLIAIGTSTGGPRALQEIVPYMPANIPAALLIVQHMPSGFTKSLAERLNSLSHLTVKEGEDGETIKPGHAYIAPGDFHMEVIGEKGCELKIKLTKDVPVGGHRPSVDVMMNSIAKTGFSSVIGVILTGMGNDGKEGIVNLKRMNNGTIISQDEQTCVVYGMPKSAVSTGVVDVVAPLHKIAGIIVKYMGVDQ
ncbi:MAG: protein-glutamate methylesterase/protein-glutamine glutaminase [Bacillota bacterium]